MKAFYNIALFFCFKPLRQSKDNQEWIVTPLIRRGSNFYFFAALYFALLDLLPCLQARGMRDYNKGSKSSRVINVKEGQIRLEVDNGCCKKHVINIRHKTPFSYVKIQFKAQKE